MSKRILQFCLALALCLALIPSPAFAGDPLYYYVAEPTGIKASTVSMMDNGMGTYKLLNDDDAVIAKGVVSPDGKLIVSRDPEPWEGMIAGDATNDTHYAGTDNAIVDLQRVNRSTDNSNTRWDLAIYDAEGNFKSFAIDVIAAYDKVDPAQRMMESKYYFGKDGYLTVFASDEEAATYAYIIEPGSLQVVFKIMLDDGSPRMGGES